uniref:Secreted protein n=1 Tax=Streptomyces sp. NBC_00093 TaxID=2975649 RepID=A0AAU2AEA3_9ACTN
MRLSTTTALGLSTLTVLALAGCSTTTSTSPSTPVHEGRTAVEESAPLSSAELSERLLSESDLGEGYTRTPQPAVRHDDVTVLGCPALAQLGGDTATGGSLSFPRTAKASFTYTGSSSSEMSEELYSDSAAKLSKGIGTVFDAMLSCPTYQVVSGSTVIDMSATKTSAPELGDEQWSQLLTYSAGGQRSVVKQTAIRTGTILVIVSGSPALVDAHLAAAVRAAQAR